MWTPFCVILWRWLNFDLRGPAAILFISRDALSNSVAKHFRACFSGGGGGYRTTIVRFVAKWGIAQMCLYETRCHGGVSHHLLTSLKDLVGNPAPKKKKLAPPPTLLTGIPLAPYPPLYFQLNPTPRPRPSPQTPPPFCLPPQADKN